MSFDVHPDRLHQPAVPFFIILFTPTHFPATQIGKNAVPDHYPEIDRHAILVCIRRRSDPTGIMGSLMIQAERERGLFVHHILIVHFMGSHDYGFVSDIKLSCHKPPPERYSPQGPS